MKKTRNKATVVPVVPPPVEDMVTELVDESKPLLSSKLAELSCLDPAELELLKSSWTAIQPDRRRQVVNRLVELAEDNLELNFDSILKYCLEDRDEEIRSKAIEGLWENEEASLIEPLIGLLERDSSEKVQAAAAMAIGKFAMLAEHEKLRTVHKDRIERALLETINRQDTTSEVRRRALEAAAPLSLPQVKQSIMDAYQSHDAGLRISSIYAMGKSCDPAWLPLLLKELDNADAAVRYEVASACGELEHEAAVPALIQLVDDPDADVRLAAIRALGNIGDARARACLKRCLESADQATRQSAEQALSGLDASEDPLSFRLR